MLRHPARLVRRSLARYQSTTTTRSAAVVDSRLGPTPATPAPTPRASSSPSATPLETLDHDEPLNPQPFIPRPLQREYQLESISTTPHDPARSTTLRFVDPSSSSSSSTPRTASLSVPNLWLRDASIHPSHVHPSSNQKLFRTTDVPLDGKLVGYGVHDVPPHGDCLVTEWSTRLQTSGMDPKSVKLSVVPLSVLRGLVEGNDKLARVQGTIPVARTWNRIDLERTLVKTDYRAFAESDEALYSTLDGLVRDGIVFLTNVPIDRKSGHDTELKRVVERIGSLRKTWYGELWDVKAEQGSRNIAYTNLDLGLHMDLTHFDHPPRYQFLHSLVNSGVTGGSSYFVDSYALAHHLRKTNPSAFETLCTEPVQFEYKNGPHWTRFQRPTIELVSGSTHEIHAVNYSPPFQGRLPLRRVGRTKGGTGGQVVANSDDAKGLSDLHEALSEFAKLCDDVGTERSGGPWRFEHQLEPGECVVFDNRRVLHARTAFDFDVDSATSGTQGAEERGRWLKGAYMDGDEVWSRWRVEDEKRRNARERPGRGRTLFV